jgi:hypothetical protein
MSSYRFRSPPAALRTARLDTLAVVPANLLPFNPQWQQVANLLPKGSTLVILPASTSPQRKTFETVATKLREEGKRVITLSAEQFHSYQLGNHGSTTAIYLAPRLARHRPAILERMTAGQCKRVRAAAREAGVVALCQRSCTSQRTRNRFHVTGSCPW